MEKNGAVTIDEVHHTRIESTELSPNGLMDFILTVDICWVDHIDMDKERLVEWVLINPQKCKRAIDFAFRGIPSKQQVMNCVVVLKEYFLFDSVLFENLHLEKADYVLDRHGIKRGQADAKVMDNQVVIGSV